MWLTAQSQRFELVELLRGFAALAVAWFHLTNTHKGTWVEISGVYGWLGVEIFFVISGFIIPFSMQSTFGSYGLQNAPTFLIRRMIRLEPAYLVSLLLVVVLYYLSAMTPGFQGAQQSYSIGQFAAHFLYIVPFTDFQWLQPVYWTLAYEFVFYLFMALSLNFFCQKNHRIVFTGSLALLCAGIYFGFLPARVLLFAMGFAVFRKQIGLSSRFEAAIVICFSICAMLSVGARLEAIVGGMTALVLLMGLGVKFHSVAARVVAALGALSYSLYLVHIPIGGRVVNLGRRFIDTPFEAFVVSAVALLVSFFAAWLLWRFVEVPSIAAARRWGKNRQSSLQAPAA